MPERTTIITDANGFAAFRPQIQKPVVNAKDLPSEFSELHGKEILQVQVLPHDDDAKKKKIDIIYRVPKKIGDLDE